MHIITKSARLSLGILSICIISACSDGSDNRISNVDPIEETPPPVIVLPGCADDSSCASNPPLMIGTDRPAEVQIPSDYTTTTRYPLIIVLHGYGSFGSQQSAYLGLDDRVDTKQYVMVRPDGTANVNGTRFWNATPACCAGVAAAEDNAGEDYSQTIDDVAYIRGLIEEASQTYSIDTSRIGLFGHSNGGFMALRMACEASDYVTALVSLAGSTFEDPASCAPAANPVSVLTIHGDLDETILYAEGAILGASYPGAAQTSSRFASLAGCDTENSLAQDNLDVVGNIDGTETTVLNYPDCDEGTRVEFWTIVGGPHIPFPWVASAQDSYVDWLIDHPRN
jgi:polyhydroxybutyrate depolymerase